MLPLIAGYDHNPAVVSLPPRVPRYSRGQGKCRDIVGIPAELPLLVPTPKLGSI